LGWTSGLVETRIERWLGSVQEALGWTSGLVESKEQWGGPMAC
jgi:hypothetical protein